MRGMMNDVCLGKETLQWIVQNIEYDKSSKGNLISVESPEKMVCFKRRGIDEHIPYMLESLGK